MSNNPFTAEITRVIAGAIDEALPDGLLFALLVFPRSQPGLTNYVSNGSRADMIEALREGADRLEREEDTPGFPRTIN